MAIAQTDLSIKEGYISVTGGKVYYKIAGAGKQGIPLLCLHGGPGATHDYFKPLESLASERPVIFYDQLGGGKSDRTEDSTLWTIERFVDELHTVRKELKLNKVHILGNSWGGSLLTEYLLAHGSEGIVSAIFDAPLISTKMWIADQQKYVAQLPENIKANIESADKTGDYSSPAYQSAMMEFYKRHVLRIDAWPDFVMRTFETMNVPLYNYMWGPSEFNATGLLKDYERTEDLKKLNVTALFICGEFDEASPESTQYFSSLLPGSEFKEIKDASHLHIVEKPEEFLSVLKDFINRNDSK